MDERRIQFAFSADAMQRLENLRTQIDGSYADVVRNALRLYEWHLAQRDYSIGLVKDGELVKIVEFIFN